jgi:hypothetical protein
MICVTNPNPSVQSVMISYNSEILMMAFTPSNSRIKLNRLQSRRKKRKRKKELTDRAD